MCKSIEITERQLGQLNIRLSQEYPKSVWLIAEKRKQVLGYTVRRHDPLTRREKDDLTATEGWQAVKRRRQVFLDFYSEKKQTWFLMKYSDIINEVDYER